MNKIIRFIGGIMLFLCSSCNFTERIEQRLNRNFEPDVKNDKELNGISNTILDQMKKKRIVFAHQSVGVNIVEGLEKIGEQDDKFQFNLKLIQEPNEIIEPGFYHFVVGQNHQPLTKLKHFDTFIRNSDNVDIAFMKFCYVDIKDTSDINFLFKNYTQMVDSLKKDNPDITFIHFTCPYRSEEDKLNANRNNYNNLKRNYYSDKNEQLFDLAVLESTKDNGNRSSYDLDGITYFKMNLPYTKDSGHLNPYGSFLVAKQLILFLAKQYDI